VPITLPRRFYKLAMKTENGWLKLQLAKPILAIPVDIIGG